MFQSVDLTSEADDDDEPGSGATASATSLGSESQSATRLIASESDSSVVHALLDLQQKFKIKPVQRPPQVLHQAQPAGSDVITIGMYRYTFITYMYVLIILGNTVILVQC